jgi:Domain of unknown function (DUF4062)
VSDTAPSDPAIRTPDQRLRVFVSSTLAELTEERQAVARAISALRLTPVMFELGARPHPPRDGGLLPQVPHAGRAGAARPRRPGDAAERALRGGAPPPVRRAPETASPALAARRGHIGIERVLAAARDLDELLVRCRGTAMLATGLTALRLRAEREYSVPPLSLAADPDTAPVAELGSSPAVALFVDRARAVRHGFALTPGNAAAVAEICRRHGFGPRQHRLLGDDRRPLRRGPSPPARGARPGGPIRLHLAGGLVSGAAGRPGPADGSAGRGPCAAGRGTGPELGRSQHAQYAFLRQRGEAVAARRPAARAGRGSRGRRRAR